MEASRRSTGIGIAWIGRRGCLHRLIVAAAAAVAFRRNRRRSRPGLVQDGPLLRRRLDRHHRDDGDRPRRSSKALGYTPKIAGAVGAGDLHLAEEQGHRRLPRQLDADHGGRPASPTSRTSPSRSSAPISKARSTRSPCPTYTYDAGLKTSPTSPSSRTQLDGKIYGIEPGNDGNRLILDMIKDEQVRPEGLRAGRDPASRACWRRSSAPPTRKEPIVFLGWEPHPMNTQVQDASISTGGDDVFGPNFGGATVYTNVRAGYLQRVPERRQAAARTSSSRSTMENEIMGAILIDGKDAGRPRPSDWLKANPEALDGWLAGVTTLDGSRRPRRGQEEPRALSDRDGPRAAQVRRPPASSTPLASDVAGRRAWKTGSPAHKMPLGALDEAGRRLPQRRTRQGFFDLIIAGARRGHRRR